MSRNSGFRSIMVPVDGSRLAEAAIPYALAIAERAHSKVRLVLVNLAQYPPLLIEPAPIYLEQLTQRYRERPGLRLSSIILNGPVAPSLAKHAYEFGADLVVMTSHGWGGLRRAWLGSVADQLIRTVEVPVMVIHPREDGSLPPVDFRQILLPLDGSLLGEVALAPAAALGQLWDSELSLVQVIHPALVGAEPVAGYDEEVTEVWRQSAEDYLQRVAARVRLTGAKASGVAVVRTSPVAATLLDLAKPEQIGLIAMATHARGGLPRAMLGSVTDKIVRAAAVPVLVVPHSRAARQVAKVQRRMLRAQGLKPEFA